MAAQETNSIPDFKPGDTVRVHVRVVEGDSERIQVFEGVVLRRRGEGNGETFTVRKISFGVGVERTFPANSPRIAKIELGRRGKARRARLYYLRELTGKAARLAEDTRGETQAATDAAADSAGTAEQAPSDAAAAKKAEAAPA